MLYGETDNKAMNAMLNLLSDMEPLDSQNDDDPFEDIYLNGFNLGETSMVTNITRACNNQQRIINHQANAGLISDHERNIQSKLLTDFLQDIVNYMVETHKHIK